MLDFNETAVSVEYRRFPPNRYPFVTDSAVFKG
jgi:hypothetical protein